MERLKEIRLSSPTNSMNDQISKQIMLESNRQRSMSDDFGVKMSNLQKHNLQETAPKNKHKRKRRN